MSYAKEVLKTKLEVIESYIRETKARKLKVQNELDKCNDHLQVYIRKEKELNHAINTINYIDN